MASYRAAKRHRNENKREKKKRDCTNLLPVGIFSLLAVRSRFVGQIYVVATLAWCRNMASTKLRGRGTERAKKRLAKLTSFQLALVWREMHNRVPNAPFHSLFFTSLFFPCFSLRHTRCIPKHRNNGNGQERRRMKKMGKNPIHKCNEWETMSLC